MSIALPPVLIGLISASAGLFWVAVTPAGSDELWKLISIPFVAGLVGWVTNWAAIQLTFKPLRYWGVRPFLGWQGIIPAKAGKMADIFVDSTMSKLGTLPELFEEMEPGKIADHVVEVIEPRLGRYTDEIMLGEAPSVWKATPQPVKASIVSQIRRRFPRQVRGLLAEASQRIEELLDFKHMIRTRLVEDPALLNRLFLDSGREEFRFIIRSGLYFGFLFGLVQLAVWTFVREWWVLPVFGLLVGWATNWIALNVIFRPLHPIRLGPWQLQGLFLKRQREVARVWCRLVTDEIVNVRTVIQATIEGPRSEHTHALIRKHMQPIVEAAVAPFQIPIRLALGGDSIGNLRDRVARHSIDVSTEPFDDWAFHEDRRGRVEELLRERMESMEPEEFQGLLRPCFQEDELTLIIVGAVLGMLAGFAQLYFVFGGP